MKLLEPKNSTSIPEDVSLNKSATDVVDVSPSNSKECEDINDDAALGTGEESQDNMTTKVDDDKDEFASAFG